MPCIKYENDGQFHYAVLLGKGGETMNEAVLPYVSEPVIIRGRLQQLDNWEFLYVDGGIHLQKGKKNATISNSPE
jgi:hypothetical protein